MHFVLFVKYVHEFQKNRPTGDRLQNIHLARVKKISYREKYIQKYMDELSSRST